jgi:NAD(P)-dependent dehydrogenase (short-subunit alcohol dehydrogenase family)
MLLKGKTAIVTGGAAGIGRAIVLGLAQAGANVAIADIASAEETVTLAKDLAGVVEAFRADVNQSGDLEEVVSRALSRWGAVDILVNNVAVYRPVTPIEDQTAEQWDSMFATNARSLLFAVQAVLPAMKAQQRGKIINIGSGVFFLGQSRSTAYAATKGAVVGFSRSLARQLGSHNIQVNVVTPGLVPGTPGMAEVAMPAQAVAHVVANQCIPRPSTPEDIVGPVLFLASNLSDFVTGQIINVDGGAMMT